MALDTLYYAVSVLSSDGKLSFVSLLSKMPRGLEISSTFTVNICVCVCVSCLSRGYSKEATKSNDII